jgi:cell division protease FtsH
LLAAQIVLPQIVLLYRQPSEPLAYSDFHQLLVAGQIDGLEIGSDQITGIVRMPRAGPLLPAKQRRRVQVLSVLSVTPV